ncbi:MAG: porin [Saprospiraceae bacterium]|nr:porin [Saprospiraceae bacterium]
MMTKKLNKLSMLVVVVLFTSTNLLTQAQDDKKFTLSGSADAYFRANFADEQNQAPGTSFADDAGFALGMANLIASYEGEKVGFVADLVFGPRGEDAVFLSPFGSSNIVNQLNVFWNVSETTTLTFGNFNTFLGYEVISPTGNFNYSTSYMFSYGPFSHAGLKADFALSEDVGLMLGVFNPTDLTDGNLTGEYNYGAQLAYKDVFFNAIYGKLGDNLGNVAADETFQVDLTTGFDISDDFYLGLNSTYNDTDGAGFYGLALYPQLATSDEFTIGLRGEYFAVNEFGVGAIGLDSDGDGSVFAATLTGSLQKGALSIKPELRLDSTSEDTFIGDADLGAIDESSLASFVLGAVYAF